MVEIVLVLVIILFASAIQGFSGFGYGLVMMSFLPFLISITDATVLSSISVIFICLYMIIRNRTSVNFGLVALPLLGNLLFIPLGVFLLNFLDEKLLKISLGILLILISGFHFLQRNREIRLNVTSRIGFLAGMLSGVLGGMLAIGGPPVVLYFAHVARDKYEYKAALDVVFLATSVYRIIWLLIFGNLTVSKLHLVIGAVIVGLTGTVIGFSWMIKAERKIITEAIYAFMILAGLSLIFI